MAGDAVVVEDRRDVLGECHGGGASGGRRSGLTGRRSATRRSSGTWRPSTWRQQDVS
jgi:hypothetical protein